MLKYTSGQSNIWKAAKKLLLTSESRVILQQNILAKKKLTPMEQLEYKVAKLERELLKKDAEVTQLKKSIEPESGDAKRK